MAAFVLVCANLAWQLAVADVPPPILPPAGEQIEGTLPFRFAMVGDNRGNMRVFEEILDAIRGEDVSLILHGGDIVKHCGPRQFDWVLHELQEEQLTVPLCPVPGNHDIAPAQEPRARYLLYRRAFGPRRYWFSYADTLFVAFDNSAWRAAPDDLDWLDRTLTLHRGQYTTCFVYMHMPPRDPRPGRSHAMKKEAEALMDILSRHRVSAAFASHIHSYLEDNVAGIPIFITGGAGASRDEPRLPYHYLLCTVEPGGSFHVVKHDVDEHVDTDYVEYNLRVKFPSTTTMVVSAVLIFAGAALTLPGSAKRRRDT